MSTTMKTIFFGGEGDIFPRDNYPGGIFLGDNFPGSNFPERQFSGVQFSGEQFSGELFSRGHFSGHRWKQLFFCVTDSSSDILSEKTDSFMHSTLNLNKNIKELRCFGYRGFTDDLWKIRNELISNSDLFSVIWNSWIQYPMQLCTFMYKNNWRFHWDFLKRTS